MRCGARSVSTSSRTALTRLTPPEQTGAFFGVYALSGVATAWRARERLAKGELPEQEMLEGLLIAVGGALLLLPGFVSDLVGLLCLLPVTRRLMVRRLRQRAADQGVRQRAFAEDLAARQGVRPDGSRLDVIEGEYRRHDPRDPKGQ